jgi:hypothetical protein
MDRYWTNTQISNVMKILPAGTVLFMRKDGRKDRQTGKRTDRYNEAKSRFLEFCERAQKYRMYIPTVPMPVTVQSGMGVYSYSENGRRNLLRNVGNHNVMKQRLTRTQVSGGLF